MSPPEATWRPSSQSNLLLWGCMGCICLPLKSAGIADADGVPIIHKTPSVQPSPLRLKQQNIKERRWSFLETAGVCGVYLYVSWLHTALAANLIGSGASATSKVSY